MFGLGLGEWVGLFLLALLVFGPRWFVKATRNTWNGLQGFTSSFQDAKGNPEIDAPPERAALKAPKES